MGFVIGGNSSGTTAETQKLGDVISAEGVTVVPALPTVRIAGTKGQKIEIKSTNYLQLYADNTVEASDGSIGYSSVDVGVAYKLELTNNTSFPDGTIQWINENKINISRLRGDVVISGTYHHNHNRLNGLVLENGRTVDIQKGSSNTLDFVRFEGATPTINFGSGTWNNTITQTWASNARAGYEPPVGNITDAGIGNHVIRKSLGQLMPRPVAIINAQQCKTFQLGSGAITSISGVQASVGGLFDFRIPANSAVMVDTGLLEMKYGEAVRFLSKKSLFRIRFYAYDSNKRQIQLTTDSAHLLCNAGTATATSGYLTQASNASGALAIIVSPDVKYVRVVVLSGTSTSGSYFDSAAVEILTNVGGEYPPAERKMSSHIPATASIPTAGFAAIGQLVKSTTSDAHYRCTFSLLTAASSAISTTSVTVDSASGVSVGDIVGIQLDDGTCHWSTVTVTSPLTIASAPPSVASAGNLVGFNRWI